jgi:hypothetical protein
MSNQIWNVLGTFLLSSFLGIVGQLIRVVAGLKKENDQASDAGETLASRFSTQQLVTSLLISLTIGGIAGVLAWIQVGGIHDTNGILALIGAGYAGTDFIEAFMKRSLPGGGGAGNAAPGPAAPPHP